ncbi:MAG: hypothetical protein ACE5J5_01425 [Candidatus Hydrothermarchaeales archaeon]
MVFLKLCKSKGIEITEEGNIATMSNARFSFYSMSRSRNQCNMKKSGNYAKKAVHTPHMNFIIG